MIADELRRQGDHFVDLVDLQERIERALPPDHPRARGRTPIVEPDADEEYEEDDEEEEEYHESHPA
jgi:hypothetical protein